LAHAVEKCTFNNLSLTSNKDRNHAKLHGDLVTMVLETDRASSQHVTIFGDNNTIASWIAVAYFVPELRGSVSKLTFVHK